MKNPTGFHLLLAIFMFQSLQGFAQESLPVKSGVHDFDFFMGEWIIQNRQVKNVRNPSEGWNTFEATQYAYPILNGLGNRDHFMTIKDGEYYEGMSLRLFDPKTQIWTIYWADTNTPDFGPPTIGKFDGKTGSFHRDMEVQGPQGPMTINLRYLWKNVSHDSAYWESSWSMDEGKNWTATWTMEMTRDEIDRGKFKEIKPTPEAGTEDFNWQMGEWTVQNRRMKNPQNPESAQAFEAQAHVKKYLNGLCYISTFTAEIDGEPYEGNSIRFYNPKEEKWKMYWIDSNSPGTLGKPVTGTFENGKGTFYRDMELANGQTIQLKSQFSDIESSAPHWEIAWSADGGNTWNPTWTMDFLRKTP